MNDNIWHDTIDSDFIEISGLVDNPKNIVKYKGKYCYLDDLLKQSEELERYKRALDIAKKCLDDIEAPSVYDEKEECLDKIANIIKETKK